MIRKYLPVVAAVIIFLLAAWFVFTEVMRRERFVQKVEIPAEYLETLDTSRYSVQSIILERAYPDDSLLLLFPESNRESQVYLYDQKNYFRLLLGSSDVNTVPQYYKEYLKAVYQRPVVNLSNLPEGKYYMHATECNFGGFFEIEISDKRR